MIIKVIYKDPNRVDIDLDKKIRKALKGIGLKWSGQGYSFCSGERDIVFNKEV